MDEKTKERDAEKKNEQDAELNRKLEDSVPASDLPSEVQPRGGDKKD